MLHVEKEPAVTTAFSLSDLALVISPPRWLHFQQPSCYAFNGKSKGALLSQQARPQRTSQHDAKEWSSHVWQKQFQPGDRGSYMVVMWWVRSPCCLVTQKYYAVDLISVGYRVALARLGIVGTQKKWTDCFPLSATARILTRLLRLLLLDLD